MQKPPSYAFISSTCRVGFLIWGYHKPLKVILKIPLSDCSHRALSAFPLSDLAVDSCEPGELPGRGLWDTLHPRRRAEPVSAGQAALALSDPC